MQIVKSQGNIVEKVLRDKEGKLIRARFFVYESGGRIKARLLDLVYLTEQVLLKGKELLLSIFKKDNFSKAKNILGISLEAESYNLTTIFNLGSKPRAPTF